MNEESAGEVKTRFMNHESLSEKNSVEWLGACNYNVNKNKEKRAMKVSGTWK